MVYVETRQTPVSGLVDGKQKEGWMNGHRLNSSGGNQSNKNETVTKTCRLLEKENYLAHRGLLLERE